MILSPIPLTVSRGAKPVLELDLLLCRIRALELAHKAVEPCWELFVFMNSAANMIVRIRNDHVRK